jgi:hypothetical protein
VHDIDSALDTIRARDATAARLAHGLWGAMRVAAAHPERVTRYDVQTLCWEALPRLAHQWRDAAAVLAELLGLLGYPGYAEICRGEITKRILAADTALGPALVRSAWRESGIEPPNSPLLNWGEVRGPVEQAVHGGVGRILEEAAENGLFEGRDEDKAGVMRIGLTMKVLTSPADDLPGTWLRNIFLERLDAWLVAGGSQSRREMLVRIRPDLERRPEFSPRYELPAVTALLEACQGGLRLTRNGYLPTALVAELAELLPACAQCPAGGRGESSWPPLTSLRYVVTELGLMRKDGNRLLLTEHGESHLRDPDTATMGVAELLIARDTSIRGVIQEVLFAALLLEPTLELDRLLDKVAIVVEEEGWDPNRHGPPVDELSRDYGWLFLQRLYILDALHVDESQTEVGLTEAGRALARWALRGRVMLREVVS